MNPRLCSSTRPIITRRDFLTRSAFGLGGLGFGIVQGLALRNYSQVVASSLVIIVITVVGSQVLGWLQRRTGDRLVPPHHLEKP